MTEHYICEPLTWAEWITILRIRKQCTKSDLAKKVGVGRTRLWQALEVKPDDPRHYEMPEEFKRRIEAYLLHDEQWCETAADTTFAA